eukprot:CAMPEP_0173342688 /NCGR_PEP_ID=MMETSP1144-20121109/10358_1 /TAXON_ID=483371 /ORGANISM="non described non described, Strain CCMP2298" /LENGTH=192 /DNA_ID=CAMNT_0014289333 /DNA_START=159 /DNA_END=735 /DNA_ORIENTATION=+
MGDMGDMGDVVGMGGMEGAALASANVGAVGEGGSAGSGSGSASTAVSAASAVPSVPEAPAVATSSASTWQLCYAQSPGMLPPPPLLLSPSLHLCSPLCISAHLSASHLSTSGSMYASSPMHLRPVPLRPYAPTPLCLGNSNRAPRLVHRIDTAGDCKPIPSTSTLLVQHCPQVLPTQYAHVLHCHVLYVLQT